MEAGLEKELRSHIEREIAANIESGMDPEEARKAALDRFGDLERIRYTARTGEFDLRSAVGGSGLDKSRQIIVETFLLCTVGTVIGLLVVSISIGALDSLKKGVGLPHWVEFNLDSTVIGFLVCVAVSVMALTCLSPMVGLYRLDISSFLKSDSRSSPGRRATLFSRGLAVLQIALSFVLMIAMGLTESHPIRLIRESRNSEFAWQ